MLMKKEKQISERELDELIELDSSKKIWINKIDRSRGYKAKELQQIDQYVVKKVIQIGRHRDEDFLS